MDVLLFCHPQIWLCSPCHANVSLFVWFRGWASITHQKKERERKLLLSISMSHSLLGLFIMI